MRTACIFCVLCALSLGASAQGLKLGAQAGLQVSSFDRGVGRAGWKGNAAATYGFNRFKLSEQIGVTVDNSSSSISMLPSRNMWRYFWADATSIAAYVPVRRESFDLSVGTGISIRRIISHTINGNPNTISDLDNRMYEWSYFLPTRIGADFHLAGGRQVVCAIEYQVSLRDIYKPAEVTGPYDYTAWVNKLHSVSLSVGYMISIPKK